MLTVIDVIAKEDSNGFTGIFTHALPRRPFLGNSCIVFSSAQRTPMVSTCCIACLIATYRFLFALTLQPVGFKSLCWKVPHREPLHTNHYVKGVDRASINVLDVTRGGLLIVASNPATPHTVVSMLHIHMY